MLPLRLDAAAPGFETGFPAFLGRNRDTDENVDRVVADIVADVRARGDAARRRLHAGSSTGSRPTPRACASAEAERSSGRGQGAGGAARGAGSSPPSASRPSTARCCPRTSTSPTRTGTRLGARYRPIDAVGVYVPGGTAAYPSSVLMNIVPAKVAGVRRIVMVVPTPDGVLNPLVMLAAEHRRRRRDLAHRRRPGGGGARLRHPIDQAGRQDHRARQRLCRRRQAPRLRPGRHRPDRRTVGDPGRRRRPERSRLDRRRSAVAGRARSLLAVGADHRRCAPSPTRWRAPSRPS